MAEVAISFVSEAIAKVTEWCSCNFPVAAYGLAVKGLFVLVLVLLFMVNQLWSSAGDQAPAAPNVPDDEDLMGKLEAGKVHWIVDARDPKMHLFSHCRGLSNINELRLAHKDICGHCRTEAEKKFKRLRLVGQL